MFEIYENSIIFRIDFANDSETEYCFLFLLYLEMRFRER